MTMQLAAYGRLGQDPREIQTSTGKSMAVASLAVTLADRHGAEATEWLGLVAFGRVAEALLRHYKGELVSVVGRAQRDDYQGRDGEPKRALQVICDAVIGARTVRPGGNRRKRPSSSSGGETSASSGPDAGAPFDDEIPF